MQLKNENVIQTNVIFDNYDMEGRLLNYFSENEITSITHQDCYKLYMKQDLNNHCKFFKATRFRGIIKILGI